MKKLNNIDEALVAREKHCYVVRLVYRANDQILDDASINAFLLRRHLGPIAIVFQRSCEELNGDGKVL